jgi:hypothetical protein
VAVKYQEGKGKVAKKPFSVWGKWHKQRQTLEEFESQGWDDANGFAIVTDYPNKDGLYLSVVDYDTKEVSEEAKNRGKQLLPKFPTTQMEKTVSEGLHLVYLSRVKPKAVKEFHKTHALELVAGGLLCVMAPSEGYEKLNDNPPTIVEDAEALFYEALGLKDKRERVNEGLPASLLEKWLKQILDSGRLKVAGEGSNYVYCHCPFHPPDSHPSFALHKHKFYGVDYHDGKVYSLKGLAEVLEVKLEDFGPPFPEVAPEELNKPLTVSDLIEILGSTVKHDDQNKAITFLSMLLTYTEEDQINLGFLAESSAGKSYIPLELSWYFPKEDVVKLGYASPTAFFHEFGEVVTDPITKRKIIHIDLKRKILIFLDQPHEQLLQRLRSLLSHDEKEIMFKITDKREKAGLRTKTVIVHGFPTVIFCTAKFGLQEQEKTRLLLLSPEISQEKLRESILLKIERESDRERFLQRMLEDPDRRLLAMRVWSLKRAKIKNVKIPEGLRKKIYDRFLEEHNYLIARHQRDISRLLAIIKGHALLNFMHRQREADSIFVNEEDVEEGFRLYNAVSEANELGLSPELFNIYKVMKPHFGEKKEVEVDYGKNTKTVTVEGITVRDFQTVYANSFHKAIGYEESRRILKTLASVGLITEEPDPIDRRKTRYTLLEGGVVSNAIPPSGKEYSSSPPTQEEYSSQSGLPPTQKEYICEVCGGKATTRVYRGGVEHWLCGKCLEKWEGPL